MDKEVEEEKVTNLNSEAAHPGNGTDPSLEDPASNVQEQEEEAKEEENEENVEESEEEAKETEEEDSDSGQEEEKEPELEVHAHLEPSKSISFAKVLKKTPNPSPPLTRGRKSNQDQIAHEAETNIHLGHQETLDFLMRQLCSVSVFHSVVNL